MRHAGAPLAPGTLAAALVLVASCSSGSGAPDLPDGGTAITVTSERFVSLGTIGSRYTCDGIDLSPDVSWSGVPEGTGSIVLFLDDPDAPGGTFTHWLVYDLPPSVSELPEGRGIASSGLPSGGYQGQNGFLGRLGYAGPCPPRGQTHRYLLHIYAVDGMLDLAARATSGEVIAAMRGRVVGHGSLTGTYGGRSSEAARHALAGPHAASPHAPCLKRPRTSAALP